MGDRRGASQGQAVEARALARQAMDTVQATASHTLSDQVENLTLTGAFAIDGTGNAGSNTLVGNGAANVLRVQTLQTIHTAKDVTGVPVDGTGAPA